MKHSADLFLGAGSLLILVANLCNFAAAVDRPKGKTKLSMRDRFVREYRHPRLRLTTLICAAGALIC
jgi:hypothetical protein